MCLITLKENKIRENIIWSCYSKKLFVGGENKNAISPGESEKHCTTLFSLRIYKGYAFLKTVKLVENGMDSNVL